jgi:dolichol-phosphate mannosyltransferase|tara:strand:+ start:544 stop:1239 length:696 start_codon:yes stop_codon:yes gene_type:complete
MITIIIPTYNESENIPILLEKISENMVGEDYEVVVVDDNSPDETWKVCESLREKYPLKVFRRINTRGLSSAVLDGFDIADGEILGVIDADLSHPPEKIPELIQSVRDQYDFAIGSRLVKGGKVELWPLHRQFISWFARMLARPLTPIKDVMSGFFFIKRSVIPNNKNILKPRGYKISLELLIKGRYNAVKEIPITFHNRKKGQSKLNTKVQFEYLQQLFELYLFRLKRFMG